MLHVQSNTTLTQAYYGTAENNHSQNDSQFEHLIYCNINMLSIESSLWHLSLKSIKFYFSQDDS